MGSSAESDGYLDAVFVSPHKLIGGPGTPGLLVARRDLFTNRVPDTPGGGTVAYVNFLEHDYLPDIEHREEGGTPDIVGSIRCGLVFQLKQAVGVETIASREKQFVTRAIERWSSHENLFVLGSSEAERTSIIRVVISARSRLRPIRKNSYASSCVMVPANIPLIVCTPKITERR